MISAILSVILGLCGWVVTLPIVSIIGLAFGLNALLKEHRLPVRSPVQKYIALLGTLLSGTATAVILIHRFL